MRIFDGKLNETREQALRDFEKEHGFNPLKQKQELEKSPESIRQKVNKQAQEKVYDHALKILDEEINRLSGYKGKAHGGLHNHNLTKGLLKLIPGGESQQKIPGTP